MNEVVLLEQVAWRRPDAPERCQGTLWACTGGIGLVGQDPASGVAVKLWLPAAKVTGVRTRGRDVLVSFGTSSIALHDLGAAGESPSALAARVRHALEGTRAAWAA